MRWKQALRMVLTMLAVTSMPAAAQIDEPLDPFLTAPAAGHLWEVPVVVINYLPTLDGVRLDSNVTGSSAALAEMRAKIATMNVQVKFALEEGSRFRGYKTPGAPPSLGYRILRVITVFERMPLSSHEVPWNPGVFRPDYNAILTRFGAESYVNDQRVKEFWIWGYHHGNLEPAESNMSSPVTGDVSNSERRNDDLPVYDSTYVLYNYNFTRGGAEAIHNHGHHIEAALGYVNAHRDEGSTGHDLFWKRFVGQNNAGAFITGRCGWTHMPPNTTEGYQYVSLTPVLSDCADWTPAGTGQKVQVNANTWGGLPYAWPYGKPPTGPKGTEKTESQFYIYWMQSLPGRGNTIRHPEADSPTSGQASMTNWWSYLGNWDHLYWAGPGLAWHTQIVYAASEWDAPVNLSPTAVIQADVFSGLAPLSVSFDATASSDRDGSVQLYLWDFGDKTSGSGPVVSHTYTAAGTYTAELRVLDDAGAGWRDRIEVVVTAPNTPPTASSDLYTLNADGSLSVPAPGVLANDVDPEAQPLILSLLTGPTGGDLVLNADGSLSYQAHLGFSGPDTFTYRVSDGSLSSGVAAVTLRPTVSSTLRCNQDPGLVLILDAIPNPVALRQTAEFASSGSHDPTTQGPLSYTWRLETGDGNFTAQTQPAFSPDGSFHISPIPHEYDASGPGSFVARLTVNELSPRQVSCTVSQVVTVDPIPGTPVAADDGYATPGGVALSVLAELGPLANDRDPEGGSLSLDVKTLPAHGTLQMNEGTGAFTYTPNSGFAGTDRFTYRALDDDFLFSYPATVTIEVGPAAAPVLLAHWKLDETSGNLASDSSGLGHDALSMAAAPVWMKGRLGGAMRFDGSEGSFVEEPDAGSYLNGLSSFTVTLWIRSNRLRTNRGFLTGTTPEGRDEGLSFRYDAKGWANRDEFKNLIKAGITTTGGVQQIESSAGVQTKGWQFLALSWRSGEPLRLYINGRLDEPTFNSAPTTGVLAGITTLRIGQGVKDLASTWNGLVDDVRIYASALSEADVQGIYLQGGDLIAHWKLDETSGTVAADSSGHGHDATARGGRPEWTAGAIGGAVAFDGRANHFLQDGDGEHYVNGLNAFTVTVWVRSDRTGTSRGFVTATIPEGRDEGLSLRYDAEGSGKRKRFKNLIKAAITTTGGVQQIESSPGVQTTDWQFLALTWQSGEPLKLYIDGRLDQPIFNSPATRGLVAEATRLRIGQGAKDEKRGWKGLVDDVRIYGRVLSAEEIASLFEGN